MRPAGPGLVSGTHPADSASVPRGHREAREHRRPIYEHTASRAGCGSGRPGRWFIEPDVIDQHRLREGYRLAWRDRGGAADGDIYQQEEAVVKDPGFPVQVGRGHGVISLVVDIPGDLAGVPGGRVHVKVAAERWADRARRADAAAPGISRPVDGPVYRRRPGAEMLHDIDLTATGPSGLADVLAEHPERGPDPASTRDLYPRLYEPVPERHPVPADQPRGGVLAAGVPPGGQFRVNPPDREGQIPGPVQGGIARRIGVILPFLVS